MFAQEPAIKHDFSLIFRRQGGSYAQAQEQARPNRRSLALAENVLFEALRVDLLLVNKPSVGLQRRYQVGVGVGTTGGA